MNLPTGRDTLEAAARPPSPPTPGHPDLAKRQPRRQLAKRRVQHPNA